MIQQTTADFVHHEVAKTYARVSGTPLGPTRVGYDDEELAELPPGVAAEFFGCGNPLSFAAVRPGQTVVDLGSGAGLDLILAGKRVGPTGRVIGVDMTDVMIARARKHVAAAGLDDRVELRKGLIEELPVESGSADWVISNCVISLSPDKRRVFSEVARVLKPGGTMIISDIVDDGTIAFLLSRMTTFLPSIAGARTEAEYVETMKEVGLIDVETLGRVVYDEHTLLGMVDSDSADASLSSTACPIGAMRDRLGSSGRALRNSVLSVAARWASGRVSSTKFRARRDSSTKDISAKAGY